ncbi:four helix bundle protein [Oscillochloris sp. ZM17-4]|uniref:four helix bundle protein n=1 Tax=Oscillochloris sp. ZM17-4 TaxID=2866714 RepID=UPI001C731564|nr:four helix bundle protein [Oscillochloris sp. ZM17-4]MBX0327669.1 four helix bundle protein [Oscillochloris sp. ZM17-4]
MDEDQFKERTKQLGLRVIKLVDALPPSRTADIIGRQVLRSATSVGANYRAACRGHSEAAMIAKLDIVLEEADETIFWLEMIQGSGLVSADRLGKLTAEAGEIVAMTVASLRTLRARTKRS